MFEGFILCIYFVASGPPVPKKGDAQNFSIQITLQYTFNEVLGIRKLTPLYTKIF
jgi:hypothetical protein